MIEHDKKELLESVKELQRDEEIIDDVTELEELIAMYLEDSKSLEPESVAEKSTNFWINYLNLNMSRSHCS